MIHDIIVWLFGVSAFGAACNLPAWGHLFIERWRTHTVPWRQDSYLLMRAAMMIGAIGVGLASWFRASSFMEYPQTQPPQVVSLFGLVEMSLPAWGPICWVFFMAVSEVLFLRVAAINARKNGRTSWAWNFFIGAMLLWTPFVAFTHP